MYAIQIRIQHRVHAQHVLYKRNNDNNNRSASKQTLELHIMYIVQCTHCNSSRVVEHNTHQYMENEFYGLVVVYVEFDVCILLLL